MDKDRFKTMMYRAQKGPISELNAFITCKLCKGYFIDATTIIECLHTFCRSCIVRYLESNKYCPICDVQVHKTKPLLNIRRDKTIQDLVYKLVPRLYQNEAKRRKLFYEGHPEAKPSLFEENTALEYEYILAPDEAISLILNYYGCSKSPRYLRCPSAVTISHLKKLIQAKYELTDQHRVELFYNQDILSPFLSLMDVAYIYSWNKKEPFALAYKIYECRAKKPKLDCTEGNESGVSRTANNNNNWKEVQLRISENGEMSITGIQDASMLELLDATENFKSEIVINESKNMDNYPKPVQVDSEIGNTEVRIPASRATDTQSKCVESTSAGQPTENHLPAKKEMPDLKYIGKPLTSSPSTVTNTKTSTPTKLLNSGIKILEVKKSISNVSTSIDRITTSSVTTGEASVSKSSRIPKSIELSETLNLNNELSVIPLSASASCVSLSSCGGTTTVFSTINKSMCSTKSDDSYSNTGLIERNDIKTTTDADKQISIKSIPKESNSLKRKCDESEKVTGVPAKLPKPTILNHCIGLMNLSNNHPLKKHSKMNRNGERRIPDISEKIAVSSSSLTVSHIFVSQKPAQDITSSKPVIINKNLNYLQMNRSSTPKLSPGQKSSHSGNVPCYMPKVNINSVGNKSNDRNGERLDISQEKVESPVSTQSTISKTSMSYSHTHTYQSTHHTSIITPAQLPHHQNLNSLQLKQSATLNSKEPMDKQQDQENVKTAANTQSGLAASSTKQKSSDINAESLQQAQPTSRIGSQSLDGVVTTSSTQNITITTSNPNTSLATTIKSKPSTPIGYKTLRDPPKSWNSQINSQIARVNQSVKAQQLANAAAVASASGNAQGRYGSELKSVRPAKFFKGRNMPRYLGNPASGVKPMYQVHVSPEKDKNQEQQVQKSEKSEIKKHSIVKIDPKTLKPISEKAPETSNLSNISTNLGLVPSQNNQELRINALSGDLKINTSSVSIFNPLKLQQNSPKNERRSPKSPHSPKVKSNLSTNTTAATTSTSTSASSSINSLSPKQQRDKTSLTFTPSNPFVPNLASPTLNPNQFLYPPGGFPSYDPRFMAACHSLWYTQRMAAAAAAGLVPPALPHAFGLNIGLNSATTIGQQPHSPGVSSKHPISAKSTSNQASPRTSNVSTTSVSKASPNPVNKKLKESAANKSEKSLETALEKLTQNKVKELSDSKPVKGNKDVRNGTQKPSTPTPKELCTSKNSARTEHSIVEKKIPSKNATEDDNNLGKLNQNESIDVSVKEGSGKKSPAEVKEEKNSPTLSNDKAVSVENRLAPIEDKTAGDEVSLTAQSSNVGKLQSESMGKKDNEKPQSVESIATSQQDVGKDEKIPTSETPTQKVLDQNSEDSSVSKTEIGTRLSQPQTSSEEPEKGSDSVHIHDSERKSEPQDMTPKSVISDDKLATNASECCTNSSDLTNDADKKPVDECITTDSVANEKPTSGIDSGSTDKSENSVEVKANGDLKDKGDSVQKASSNASEKPFVAGSDPGGGGEKSNSV